MPQIIAAEAILPAALFAALMAGTPGPANMVLMAAGAKYGTRRSLVFLLGVQTGFVLVLLLTALGMMTVLDHYPAS